MTSTFRKDNQGKPCPSLLPPRALLAVARVLTHGAAHYGRENWHKVTNRSTYFDALQRHLLAWWSGEDKDAGTGESHLAHAGCCLLFLLELEARGFTHVEDDRPVAQAAADHLTHWIRPHETRALPVCGARGENVCVAVLVENVTCSECLAIRADHAFDYAPKTAPAPTPADEARDREDAHLARMSLAEWAKLKASDALREDTAAAGVPGDKSRAALSWEEKRAINEKAKGGQP